MTPNIILFVVVGLVLIGAVMSGRRTLLLLSAAVYSGVLVWLAVQEINLVLPAMGVAIVAGLVLISVKLRTEMEQDAG